MKGEKQAIVRDPLGKNDNKQMPAGQEVFDMASQFSVIGGVAIRPVSIRSSVTSDCMEFDFAEARHSGTGTETNQAQAQGLLA